MRPPIRAPATRALAILIAGLLIAAPVASAAGGGNMPSGAGANSGNGANTTAGGTNGGAQGGGAGQVSGGANIAPSSAAGGAAAPAATAPAASSATPPASTTTLSPTAAGTPSAITQAPTRTGTVTVAKSKGSSGSLSGWAILAAAVAGLAALVCLTWAIFRFAALEPHWLLSARHSVAEAGFRTSSTWAEFRDWVRLGH